MRRRQRREASHRSVASVGPAVHSGRGRTGRHRGVGNRRQTLGVADCHVLARARAENCGQPCGLPTALRLLPYSTRLFIGAPPVPNPPSKKKLDAWRKAGANPADKPKTYFRLEPVFSAEQVEPLPPPAQPVPLDPPIAELQGDSLAWALAPLEQLAGELGYTVVYRPLAKGHGGSCNYKTRVITINDDASINAQVDVGCHEIAHALTRVDRQEDDPELDYAGNELVAESVAHIACSFVGFSTSASSVPYLAVWSEQAPEDTFERIAALVDRLARRLEQALGAEEPPDVPVAASGAAADAAAVA